MTDSASYEGKDIVKLPKLITRKHIVKKRMDGVKHVLLQHTRDGWQRVSEVI